MRYDRTISEIPSGEQREMQRHRKEAGQLQEYTQCVPRLLQVGSTACGLSGWISCLVAKAVFSFLGIEVC